jgi:hypothetical protein
VIGGVVIGGVVIGGVVRLVIGLPAEAWAKEGIYGELVLVHRRLGFFEVIDVSIEQPSTGINVVFEIGKFFGADIFGVKGGDEMFEGFQ